jgi:hypothetical protein
MVYGDTGNVSGLAHFGVLPWWPLSQVEVEKTGRKCNYISRCDEQALLRSMSIRFGFHVHVLSDRARYCRDMSGGFRSSAVSVLPLNPYSSTLKFGGYKGS